MSETEPKLTGFARLADINRKKEAAKLQEAQSSLSNMSCQPTEQPPASPQSNQPIVDKQPTVSSQPIRSNHFATSVSIISALPSQKGDTRISHRYSDYLCRMLKPDEQAVYWQLYRLSWGWNKDTCFISNPKLSERSNVPLSSMKRAVTGLISKGLIYKTGHTNGYGKEQGVEYRLPTLNSQSDVSRQSNTSRQPTVDTIKENTIKETHTNTEVGVRVSSRFSLAECRRYAESLRADGITNPGGYATKVQRSAEADELIAKFLEPIESAKPIDVSACPDCHGTGFYEPGGAGKGVAKCKHHRMPL